MPKISTFGGMLPSIDETLLPDGQAANAKNTWLYSGALAGINQPTLIRALTAGTGKTFRLPQSFVDGEHLSDSLWYEFPNADTDIVRTQVINDQFERYYWANPADVPRYSTRARMEQKVTSGNDQFTKVLLHFDGTDGSTTITDENFGGAAKTWTANGNAQIDTAQSVFGGASLLCDGTGDYVSTPDHADFTITTGVTIDLRVRPNVNGTLIYAAGQMDSTGFASGDSTWLIAREASNKMSFSMVLSGGGGAVTVTSLTSIVTGAFYNIRCTWNGTQLRIHVNGVLEATAAYASTPNNSTEPMVVGRGGSITTNEWNGWVDEFKFDNGIARNEYVTSPSAPFGYNEPWKLGVPAPSVAPTVSPTGGSSSINRTTAYVYTWVTEYGEEGPPSPPTTQTGKIDASWDLTLTAPASTDTGGVGDDRNIKFVNIYRTITAATGITSFYFVATQAVTDTTYSDTALDATVAANTTIQSTNWSAPPTDLQGWVAMPNGILVGFRENEVWFSEPYRFHAWPAGYTLSVDYPIVGLGVIGQTVVVCTQSYPFAITGVHPSAMTQAKIMNLEPCASRGSILSAPEGVYYASSNGLILIANGKATNISQKLVTKDKWQSFVAIATLYTLRAARLGTAYYAFGTERVGVFQEDAWQLDAIQMDDTTGSLNGMLVDPANERVAFNILSETQGRTTSFNDPWSGELLIIKQGNLYHLDIAQENPLPSYEPFIWRTKLFQAPARKNFGAMRIFFDVEGLTVPTQNPVRNTNSPQTLAADQYGLVRVFVDDVLKTTREIRTSGELMRIPSGYKGDYWQFEFEARVRIKSFEVAVTPKDLGKL